MLEHALGHPSITWRGLTLDCVPISENDSNELVAGGYLGEQLMHFVVRLSQFTTRDLDDLTADNDIEPAADSTRWLAGDNDGDIKRPTVGDRVQHGARLLRVVEVVEAAPGSHIVLRCDAVDK